WTRATRRCFRPGGSSTASATSRRRSSMRAILRCSWKHGHLDLMGLKLKKESIRISHCFPASKRFAQGAIAMGLAKDLDEARVRQHTPKIAWVAPPKGYRSSSGRDVPASEVNLVARIMSMGKLHHAMTGTGAVAIGTAAAIPGTLVQ